MKAVVQRVKNASVTVEGKCVGRIGEGLLALIGIGKTDTLRDMEWMADKICHLRIFETEEGKLDKSLMDIKGELLLVSQFTLYGECSKGRRPSFSDAMGATGAGPFFQQFVNKMREGWGKSKQACFRRRWMLRS